MSHLILVKHAMPVIDARGGAREWVLSDAGRGASILLAERLTALDPDVIMTSVETKARQTAEILAARLKKPLKPFPPKRHNLPIGFYAASAMPAVVTAFFLNFSTFRKREEAFINP